MIGRAGVSAETLLPGHDRVSLRLPGLLLSYRLPPLPAPGGTMTPSSYLCDVSNLITDSCSHFFLSSLFFFCLFFLRILLSWSMLSWQPPPLSYLSVCPQFA